MVRFSALDEVTTAIDEFVAKGEPFLFAIDYELEEAFFVPDPQSETGILYQTALGSNVHTERNEEKEEITLVAHPISYEEYAERFDVVMEGLRRGDSFLANLTLATPITINASLEEVFYATKATYKLCLPNRFVCFSPESFVRIDTASGRIETRPMKGTIDASLPNAREQILSDSKELAEHYTIVDLMRSDLARVSSNIKVERFRYIDTIHTAQGDLLQVSSLIAGEVLPHYSKHLGSLLKAILPAGSICGAPKEVTRRLIARAEKGKRGFYSGVFGVFDGQVLDSAVMIRFIVDENGNRRYHSGGGITINSRAKDEYHEVIQKIYLPR